MYKNVPECLFRVIRGFKKRLVTPSIEMAKESLKAAICNDEKTCFDSYFSHQEESF
jgi:hypothetical protein